MAKCEVCRKIIAAAVLVKCSKCSASHHRNCTNLAENVSPYGWFCFGCTNKTTHSENHKDPTIDLVLEIRSFKDELSALRAEVRAYRDEITEFKSTLNMCKVAIDAMDVRLASLELKSDDNSNNEAIIELESEINARHQEVLANDLEIAGVPENIGENLHQIVQLLSDKLGVHIEEREISHAERIGPISHQTASTAKAPRPRHIVVSLTRRITREHLLRAVRIHRGLTSADVGVTGSHSKIYINERLTPHNKRMFYLARKNGEEHNWRYIWRKNGKIFARRDDGEQVVHIRCIGDLNKIVTPVL